MTNDACDVHGTGDGTRPSERCERCRRFGFLSGYALRTDEEEAEVHATVAWLRSIGRDPGWAIVAREAVEPIVFTGVQP